MTTPAETTDMTRTSRAIVRGTWACAGIVMVTSAGNAILTFGALGGNRAIGLGLGVAVDIALFVGLVGDRRLSTYGLKSGWGRGLRITAAVMSGVLNTGAALIAGNYFLALLHAFLPSLLVVLTEYGQDVHLKFAALRATRVPAVADTRPTPAELPVAAASVPIPPAHPVAAIPAKPAPAPRKQSVPSGATPALLARVRKLRDDRARDGKQTGRRVLVDEVGISDGLARKVLAALDSGEVLRSVAGGAR